VKILDHFLMSFSLAMDPGNLLAALIGCLFGTLVGVLPGLGPVATMALLLPLIYKMKAVQAIILFAGIYYGAQYGGSTTSILVNIPGEASSVVTCLDGYQMARKGRAGPALGISAFGSFIGGTFAVIVIMLLAPPLAEMAIKFGPPENLSIMFFGLTMVTYLAQGSMIKALMMGFLGLLLGCVGTDLLSGNERYIFGINGLGDGLGIAPVAIGLFGISEMLLMTESRSKGMSLHNYRFKDLFPTKQDWRDSAKPILRGTLIGSFLGLFPGGAPAISSFLSYGIEKKISKHPERFGTGEIAGVAGPETANNASCGSAFIPLLCLGIPTTGVMGVLLGAFLIKGVPAGPLLLERNPDLFWGVIGSLYLGNVMLLVLNLPLIPLWVKVLKVPPALLTMFIYLFCLIGTYSINNSTLDIYVMNVFGIIGYLMKKFEYPQAPLILAFILGANFEKYLGQSLIMGDGSPVIFFTRPVPAVFISVAILILAYPLISKLLKRRRLRVPAEDMH
jgi:putative tricarboxylic transport membrane protein